MEGIINRKKSRKSSVLAAVVVTVVVMATILSGIYHVKKEISDLSLNKASLNSSLAGTIYRKYVTLRPTFDSVPQIGNAKAPIVMLVYLEPGQEAARRFIETTYPMIVANYVRTGRLRLYLKPYVNEYDIEENSKDYRAALYMACISMLESEKYEEYMLLLIRNGFDSLRNEIMQNISSPAFMEEFIKCASSLHPSVSQDAFDIEKSQAVGISPLAYVGVDSPDNRIIGLPGATELNRTIAVYERQLGY